MGVGTSLWTCNISSAVFRKWFPRRRRNVFVYSPFFLLRVPTILFYWWLDWTSCGVRLIFFTAFLSSFRCVFQKNESEERSCAKDVDLCDRNTRRQRLCQKKSLWRHAKTGCGEPLLGIECMRSEMRATTYANWLERVYVSPIFCHREQAQGISFATAALGCVCTWLLGYMVEGALWPPNKHCFDSCAFF